jgi:adenine-specific DNA-methyltransferase
MNPTYTIHHGDALAVLRTMPDASVDLIATDPPYFRVKNLAWDRAWSDADAFIAWMCELCVEWRRVLRPNGSLYVFAGPRMAARVEVEIGRHFHVLNQIVWRKIYPWHRDGDPAKPARIGVNGLRSFFPVTERIVFAEQHGADGNHTTAEDRLRGSVFEPLRAYLNEERDRAGHTTATVDAEWQAMRGTKGCMAGHWFGQSQWELPTPKNYDWLRVVLNAAGGNHLARPYEDLRRECEDLRREFEALRREFEALRRPFAVTAEVPFTDVWTFPTVSARGKHLCEKPLAMMEHIVRTSSRPGAVVLDCFAGSGVTGEAALRLGRSFVGVELDPQWVARAQARLDRVTRPAQAGLFDGGEHVAA